MNAPALLRKGWCPGALRPMPTGDGLLVRVRLACRRLDPASVEALADCAAQYGNGVTETSSRANLQLRGVAEASLPALQRRLDALGLIDADIDGASIGNILVSPLSDIDSNAIVDGYPIATAMEARLRSEPALRRLPPKFGFLIDFGGGPPLGDVEADIRFEALLTEGAARFAVKLAGAEDVAAFCAPDDVADVAARLALAFVARAGAGADAPRRMRGLIVRIGATALFAAAGLTSLAWLAARDIASPKDLLGAHALGASTCVGAAAPLGRTSAEQLRALAQGARRLCARDIRLTPWRALIVTGLDRASGEELATALAEQGFILDPSDRRLAVIACAGAPACANASRPVQAEALEFAAAMAPARGFALHISGCAKGCAHGRPAPITLVARDSRYDCVIGGKASDQPSHFALSKDEVMSLLAQGRIHQQ